MDTINLIIMLFQALIMLFQLRSIMQSSSMDYYNPLTQIVVKLTNPVMNILPIKNIHFKGFFYCGFIVSIAIAYVASLSLFYLVLGGTSLPVPVVVPYLIIPFILTIKTFGYLVLFLLLAQALTSWLPSTRDWSFTFAQLTYPFVAPVQRVIPPIGMIDISLMIVMIAIFALNRLFFTIFGVLWFICQKINLISEVF